VSAGHFASVDVSANPGHPNATWANVVQKAAESSGPSAVAVAAPRLCYLYLKKWEPLIRLSSHVK